VVFRQLHTSRIALNAHSIRENKVGLLYGDDFEFIDCGTDEKAAEIICERYMREVGTSGINNVQILSPFRKNGKACVKILNETLRELVNPKSAKVQELKVGTRIFREKNRILQTKNKNGISNGDVGVITKIFSGNDGNSTVTIEFSDDRVVEYGVDELDIIEHSYAMTIHKSQGSEYDTVIIPVLKSFYIMLKRNLMYTAITRAKKKVVLVGQKQALAMAIKANDTDKRNTMLAARIQGFQQKSLEKKSVKSGI
jgi:exodeoxyribonuclease V alpha subunit